MRKAFTLVEMIVVIAVLPVATLALSWVFATFVRDVPRMVRVVERNATVLDLVRQMREDLDRAVALPDTFGACHRDWSTLLVERVDGAICYEFREGQAVRSWLGRTEVAEEAQPRRWVFPDAEVVWSCWQQDGVAYAVEIRSHVNQKVGSKMKARLANSYVLFVGGFGKGGQEQ